MAYTSAEEITNRNATLSEHLWVSWLWIFQANRSEEGSHDVQGAVRTKGRRRGRILEER